MTPVTLLKKRLWHRCFPVNSVKFLRAPFLTEHLRWLLLLFDSFHDIDSDLHIFQIKMESKVETSGFLKENRPTAPVIEKYTTSFVLISFLVIGKP